MKGIQVIFALSPFWFWTEWRGGGGEIWVFGRFLPTLQSFLKSFGAALGHHKFQKLPSWALGSEYWPAKSFDMMNEVLMFSLEEFSGL